jgi:putative Ca2+/H+ antiporter (TMEM165/GDT1 family)
MLIVSSIALYVGIALKKKINEKVYQKIIKELLFTLATVLIIQVSV